MYVPHGRFLEDMSATNITELYHARRDEIFDVPVPSGIGRTEDGKIFVAWIFARLKQKTLTGGVRVTILGRGTKRPDCTSSVLPLPTMPYPRVAVRGDTVFALQQVPVGDGNAVTKVFAYLVGAGTC